MQGVSDAQNQTLDSLLTVLKKTKEDTAKVNTLNELSFELMNNELSF